MDNYGFGIPVLNGENVLTPVTDKQLRYIAHIQECLDVAPFFWDNKGICGSMAGTIRTSVRILYVADTCRVH